MLKELLSFFLGDEEDSNLNDSEVEDLLEQMDSFAKIDQLLMEQQGKMAYRTSSYCHDYRCYRLIRQRRCGRRR